MQRTILIDDKIQQLHRIKQGEPKMLETVLTLAATTVFNTLVTKATEKTLEKLKGDKTQKAFKVALATAIKRYASGDRVSVAQPLLSPHGLFADKDVTVELSYILRFEERQPDYKLIGNRWKDLLEIPPSWINFDNEARRLVSYLEEELKLSGEFTSIFDAKSLEAIADNTAQTTDLLESLIAQLDSLSRLMATDFQDLIEVISSTSKELRRDICYFAPFISDKTLGFVGRTWIFEEINKYVKNSPKGYFFIAGQPGIGKSALAAQMVKENGYIHHFNIRADGMNTASLFLRNICAQLIARYKLNYSALPDEAGQDSRFLNGILHEVSSQLLPDERVIIIVDAIDEADTSAMTEGTNRLYLPTLLPEKIFLIATSRDDVVFPTVNVQNRKLTIKADSSANLSDIADYLRSALIQQGIKNFMSLHQLDEGTFVKMMIDKSMGNFMYLSLVLPEIEKGNYRDKELRELPDGLVNYYETHWRRMRGEAGDSWFEYKLPVLVALAAVPEPLSIRRIQDYTKISKASRIQAVLEEWKSFLSEESLSNQNTTEKLYRLYHSSFFDFISRKQEVKEERVDLEAMLSQIADVQLNELYNRKQN